MKSKKVIVISVISIFVIIGVLIGGYFLFMNTIFAKPDIYLYQPNKPLTINLSEGIQFVAEGSSKRGIAYIEFQENGRVIDKKYPPEAGAESLLTYIYWIPRNVGLYELSLVAYDQGGMASDPAKVTIGVISDGLTVEEVNRTEKAVTESEPAHVIQPVSGGSGIGVIDDAVDSGDESDDGGLGGAGGEDDEEAPDNDDHGWGEGREDEDRPLENDLPPEITSFDIRIGRNGNNVDFSIFVTAEDDHGVDEIYFAAFSNAFDNGRIEVYQDCGGVSPCNFSKNMILKGDASYDIIATAVDTIGQNSAISYRHFTVGSDPNEPFAIAVEVVQEEIIPVDFIGLILMENGIFQMQPFFGAGWLGSEDDGVDEPEDACAPSTMQEIIIGVEQEYRDNHIPVAHIDCSYPCNLQTDAEDPFFCVQIEEIGSCRTGGSSDICPARLSYMADQPYVDQPQIHMYREESSLEDTLCGRGNVTLIPVAIVEGEVVETGAPYQFETLPCPPPPPDFWKLRTATTCFSDSEWCLIGDIGRNPRFDDSFEHLPVDHYEAIERIFDGEYYDENTIIIRADNPYYYNASPRWSATYEIEIYSVSPEGIRGLSKRINLRVYRDDTHILEQESRNWDESR